MHKCDMCKKKSKDISCLSYGRCLDVEDGEPVSIDRVQMFLCRLCTNYIKRAISVGRK